MKRFSVGFMKSISSSYEVELTDNSSTFSGGDLNSMSTDEGFKSSARKGCGVVPINPIFPSKRNSFREKSVMVDSSSDEVDSVLSTNIDEKRNGRLFLPATRQSSTKDSAKHTNSDDNVTGCATQSTKSFSLFLTAVDGAVDAVVDALLPLNDKNMKAVVVEQLPQPVDEAKKGRAVSRKSLFFHKNRSKNNDAISVKSGSSTRTIPKSEKDSTTSSLSRRSFRIRNKVEEQQPAGRDDDWSLSSSFSKFSLGLYSPNKVETRDSFQTKTQLKKDNRSNSFIRNRSTKSFGGIKNTKKKEEIPVIVDQNVNEEDLNVFDCFFKVINGPESGEAIAVKEKEPKKKKRGIFKFRKNKEEKKRLLRKQKSKRYNQVRNE
jgi:hypothetical protein